MTNRRLCVRGRGRDLQDQAFLLLLLPGEESSAGGMLEDLADAFVGLCGAFEVLESADLLADILGLRAIIKVSVLKR